MELGNRLPSEADLQTETTLLIDTKICCPLENSNVQQEPDFHTNGDSEKLSDPSQYAVDGTNIVDVKTEVVDNSHYGNIDHQNYHGICSSSNNIDTGILHGIHVPLGKSAQTDDPLETTAHSQLFIIGIDTCKDEYYATHGHPNNQAIVELGLGESGVEQESGGDCVRKEDMYMEHTGTQHQRWVLHKADTTSCSVVVRDIRYTYPDIVNHDSVLIHDPAPTLPIQTQAIYVNVSEKPPPKHFTCSECGAGFRVLSSLKTHILIHTGEKPHKCGICGVSFTVKGDLTRHIRTHTGEKPYKCSVCGAGLTYRHTLHLHTLIHTGEKPHKCAVCEVSFRQKGALTAHMRTHTGEKPYTCSFCGVGFAQSSEIPHSYTYRREAS